MTDHVKFAIDMSQGVELIDYPEIYLPFNYFISDTEYKDYDDFMTKQGYVYSTATYRYRIGKDAPKNAEQVKNEKLQAMIDEKALPLIEKYNKKFNSN